MTGYLLRRILQMVVVLFLSAVATYALLNLAPGGPMSGLRQTAQTSKARITEEDPIRIRAYYELDLYLPLRFSRWLIGQPNGRIIIGQNEYFPNVPIGCGQTIEKEVLEEVYQYAIDKTKELRYNYKVEVMGNRRRR